MDDERRKAVRRGYWLKLARDQAGMTLSGAAQAAGLGPKSGGVVSRWESGERDPKMGQLERMAAAYGVPAAFFVEPEPTDVERLARAKMGQVDAVALEQSELEEWVTSGAVTPAMVTEMHAAFQSGGEEGMRRAVARLAAADRLAAGDREPPAPSPVRLPRGSGAARG